MKLLARVQRSVRIVEERTVLLDVPDHIIQQYGDLGDSFFAVFNQDYDYMGGPWEVTVYDTDNLRLVRGPEIIHEKQDSS